MSEIYNTYMDILTKKNLRRMKSVVSVFVAITTIVWLSGVALLVPAKAAITDGSLIRATGDYKVYIVNGTYKRWIQSADIFKFYKHLGFAVVQDVSPAVADSYTAAWLVRADGDPKVYEINGDGTKHHLEMSAEQFVLTGRKWDMVSIINTQERDWYVTGANVNYVAPGTTPSPSTTPAPVTGGLTVSLSADTPVTATIPNSATGVAYTKFNVTAGASSATVTEIVLTRTGAGAAGDFANVYLYEGDTRLTNGRSVSSDTNTITFSNLNLAVSSGATKTLTVKADMNGSITGKQNALGVTKVNGTAVTGVNGNIMSMGAVNIGTATIDNSSASWSVNVGTSGAEVGKFTIAAGSDDLKLHAITLVNGGSLQNSYITNLKLSSSSVELGSVAAMNGSKATIVLNSDFVITKNQTKTFTVTADLTGGRRNDTIVFYVEQAADVNVIDSVYGYGANLTNSFSLNDQTVTLTGGKVTLSLNGPAAGTIGKNTTNQTLMKINMSSEANITVRDLKLNIALKDASALVVDSTDAQWALIKNVKIVDLDSGTTLQGPITNFGTSYATTNSGTTGASGTHKMYKVFSDDFDVAAGATRHLAVQADIDSTFTASYAMTADVDLSGTNYIYDNSAGQSALSTDIVPNTLTGNQQTVGAASLTVSAGTAVSRTVVKGATNVEGLNVVLSAGTADSLKVNKIVARVYGDDDATFDNSGYGDTAANSLISTVSLYEGATLLKGPVNVSLVGTIGASGGYYKAEFTSLNYAIAAGAQKNLSLKFNVSSSVSGTNYIAVDVLRDDSDIEVEDSKGNLLTDSSILPANTNLNLAASPSPVVTVAAAGTLTAAVDGTTPLADIVVSGTSSVEFTKYKFTATNEAFTVTGLKIEDTSSAYDDNITKITLVYPVDAAGTTATKDAYLSAGSVTLADGQINMYVPKDKTAVLTIKADLNTVANGADSGDTPKLQLTTSSGNLTNQFIILGESSGTKLYGSTNTIALDNTNVKQMTVRKTKVVGKVASDSPSGTHASSASDNIAVFQFDATAEPNSSQNSTITAATVQITGSLIDATAGDESVTVTLYNAATYNSGTQMGTATITGVDASSSTATAVTISALNEFSSTQKVYAVIDTTDADFVNTTGTDSLVMRMTTYTWNDSTAGVTPVTGIPVIANTLSY